jgi:hypothetical protein
MALEFANQRYLPSLLHNGSFTRGAAYWSGSFVRHVRVGGSEGNGTLNAPQYALRVARPADEAYAPGVPPGVMQFVDRPDLAVYPSSRQVSGLLLTPYSRTQALLQTVIGATAIEGVVLTDNPAATGPTTYANLFQHPFFHQELSGATTTIESGAELPLVDTRRPSASGVYRVGRTLINYSGDAAFVSVPTNVLTYHGVEISATPSSEFTPILTSDTPTFTAGTSVTTDSVATVTVFMDPDVAKSVDRGQPGFAPEIGLAAGDVFTSYAPNAFSTIITGIEYLASAIVLALKPLDNYGKSARPIPPNATVDVTSWDIFPVSSCNVVTTMPLFKYDYTLATTYRISADSNEPDPSIIEFRTLGLSDVAGFGAATAIIPRVEGTVRNLVLDSAGSVDLDQERRLERFVRESDTPLPGRMDVRIVPKEGVLFDPDVLDIVSLQKFPRESSIPVNGANVPFPLGAVVFSVNTPTGGLPVAWTQGKLFALSLDEVSTTSEMNLENSALWLWIQKIEEAGFLVESVDDDASSGIARIVMAWDPLRFGEVDDGVDQPVLNNGDSFSLLGLVAAFGVSELSDVYLAKGDFTEKFEKLDDPAYASTDPITDQVAIDFLQHGMDQLEGVIPKGMVMLYAGGAVCPPGYKRVDAFPNAPTAGIGAASELPIPSPIEYDALTDRTTLTWQDQDFPLLDANGAPVILTDLSEPKSLEVPPSTGIFETVNFTVNQQVFQPGMHLRVPATTLVDKSFGIYLGSTSGYALTLAPDSREYNAGQVQVPHYPELAQEWVGLEIWFRTDGTLDPLGTILASKWQKISGTLVGWSVILNDTGTITVEQRLLGGGGFTGGTNSFTTTRDYTGLLTGTLGFWRVYITFASKQTTEPTLGFDGSIDISNEEFGYQANRNPGAETWNWGSANDRKTGTMANTGPLIIGARPNLSQTPVIAGGNVTLDMFRQFKLGPGTIIGEDLWNIGAGLTQIPSSLDGRLTCELRFDEGLGTTVRNTSSLPGVFDGVTVNQTFWGEGNMSITTESGLYGEVDYRGPLEDRDKSFLITDLKYNIQEQTGNEPSGKPYDATNAGNQGSGSGTVNYPDVVLGSNIADGDLSTPPVGPGNAAQTEVFDNITAPSGLALFTVLAQTVVGGRLTGFSCTSSVVGQFDDLDPFVGNVYWLQLAGPPLVDNFATRLTKIDMPDQDPENAIFFFDRYDGKSVDLRGADPAAIIGNTVTIRPVILYGTGEQALNAAGIIIPLGITQNRVFDQNEAYWTTRLSVPDIEVTLQGNLVVPDLVTKLIVEPAGYLKYSEPDSTQLDYGSGGHSHKLDGDSIVADIDAVPKVNEFNNDFKLTVPFTDVASEHGHGILSTYRYPLPSFRMFTLCEKL